MSVFDNLKKPFPKDKIHWRVGATTNDKTNGIALAYVDARDVMQRLDEVIGVENWQAEYPFPGCCRIGIRVCRKVDNEGEFCGWVWKANGAGETDVEGAKGQYSDAFKRAGVLWGIAQYLYDLPNEWVPIEPSGRSYKLVKPHTLPQWALPGAKIDRKVVKEFVDQITEALSSGDDNGVKELWAEWTDVEEKTYLWGKFNSQQRSAMKELMK